MLEFDPFSEAHLSDPLALYRRLRDEAPAYYSEKYDCFFLSRFQDVHDSCRNKVMSHRRGTTPGELLLGHPVYGRSLARLVPPEHTHLRAALNPAFLPGKARAMEGVVRAMANRLLDAAGDRLDAKDFAQRIAAEVTFHILGLPAEEALWASDQVVAAARRVPGVNGMTPEGVKATDDLKAYLMRTAEARRARPQGHGLIETILDFEFEGRRMPDEEVLDNLYLMVVGGTETLPRTFAGMVYQLWKLPEQRAAVVADPELAQDAFWEAVRFDMPTLMLGAWAEEDTEMAGGVPLKKHQKVMHLWASANRDDREFADPDRFDLFRRAPRIVSFNPGRHICLGIHVAQMEGRIMLQELLARSPGYGVDEAGAVRERSEFFRGFLRLPLTLESK